MKIDASTFLCATLGMPNRNSRSPVMHNAGFAHLGIPYVYLAFEPRREGLAAVFAGMRALDIRGFSVTKPYKQEVMSLLDELDVTARTIGAVNTVFNDAGRLVGYNSDWVGAADAIEEVAFLKGKRVVLLGAGGAARAVAYACRERGASVRVYNRTISTAAALAKDFGLDGAGSLKDAETVKDWDVLINTTSVGMAEAGDASPIDGSFFERRSGAGVVLDAVIVPKDTPLLRDAASYGHKIVYGARMTVLQGCFQFKLFTGHDAPVEVMMEALLSTL
jgi:shikimate dehydrogenase